jgi:hypothetical protein
LSGIQKGAEFNGLMSVKKILFPGSHHNIWIMKNRKPQQKIVPFLQILVKRNFWSGRHFFPQNIKILELTNGKVILLLSNSFRTEIKLFLFSNKIQSWIPYYQSFEQSATKKCSSFDIHG